MVLVQSTAWCLRWAWIPRELHRVAEKDISPSLYTHQFNKNMADTYCILSNCNFLHWKHTHSTFRHHIIINLNSLRYVSQIMLADSFQRWQACRNYVFYYCLAIINMWSMQTLLKVMLPMLQGQALKAREGNKTGNWTLWTRTSWLKYLSLSSSKRKQIPSKISTDSLNAFTRPFRPEF